MALTDKLTNIGNAIREKTGKTDKLTLDEMVTEIGNISGSSNLQEKSVEITQNGTTDIVADSDYDGLSKVEVNVSVNGDDNWEINNGAYLFYKGYRANAFDYLFERCKKITNAEYMFYELNESSDTSLSSRNIDFSKLDTSNCTNMRYMFTRFSVYKFDSTDNYQGRIMDLSNFDTSKVTNMSYMFYNIYGKNLTKFIIPFDTSNVTNMDSMFSSVITDGLDLSSFNTSKVTNMSYMFNGCSRLTSLDLSNFDTSKVTNMSYMFHNCSSLTSLILGENFINTQITSLSQWTVGTMFNSCSSLEKLIIKSSEMLQIVSNSITNMKSNCNIYVPDDLVDTYKADTYWSKRADYILPLSELPDEETSE